MFSKLKNITSFAMKPRAFRVLIDKIYSRFFDSKGSISEQENLNWLEEQAVIFADLVKQEDKKLWLEAKQFGQKLKARAEKELVDLGVTLGGGGFYEMLYFLTRKYQPTTILETGVAAGYSSASFLAAIDQNKKGTLYSSDFPYFRIEDPEKFIGILVDKKYRKAWKLYIAGDQKNFAEILSQISQINLFHYDSDKRYRAKWSAYNQISSYLSPEAIVLFDDIQDDAFFYDFVLANRLIRTDWDVIKFEGKYIGWVRASDN
jgi:predicted O-methyltransferase YrrM